MLAFETKYNKEQVARLARAARIERRAQELAAEQKEWEAQVAARAAKRAAK